MKKYWHELENKEVEKIMKSNIKVGEFLNKYKQPDWCNYHEALSGIIGCWSLMRTKSNNYKSIITEEYCKTCELYESSVNLNKLYSGKITEGKVWKRERLSR